MMRDKNGFVLVETIVVLSIIMGIFIFTYSGFFSIYNKHKIYSNYIDINNIYAAQNIKEFIVEDMVNPNRPYIYHMDDLLANAQSKYIYLSTDTASGLCEVMYDLDNADADDDITTGIELGPDPAPEYLFYGEAGDLNYCNVLFEALEVSSIIFTYFDITTLIDNDINEFPKKYQDYLINVVAYDTFNPDNDQYRLIISYTNGGFATASFDAEPYFEGVWTDWTSKSLTDYLLVKYGEYEEGVWKEYGIPIKKSIDYINDSEEFLLDLENYYIYDLVDNPYATPITTTKTVHGENELYEVEYQLTSPSSIDLTDLELPYTGLPSVTVDYRYRKKLGEYGE